MAGRPISAKNANIRIAAFVFYGSKWDVSPETDFEDTSSFEDGGAETQVACFRKCEVTLEGYWDGDQNPYDSPPNFQTGQRLVNVKLYINTTAGPYWLFPL